MKLVTFSKTVLPHRAGDKLLVPDHVAELLRDRGEISSAEEWPERRVSQPEKPRRPIINLKRPAGSPDRRQAR